VAVVLAHVSLLGPITCIVLIATKFEKISHYVELGLDLITVFVSYVSFMFDEQRITNGSTKSLK